jgi:acetate kinase
MKILTINCGSSSVKYALLEVDSKAKLCHGLVDRINTGRSFIEYQRTGKEKISYSRDCPSYDAAIHQIIEMVTDQELGVVRHLSEIEAVGHRVVHGGESFRQAMLIDDRVIAKISEYAALAPLHNPANLAGIRAMLALLPTVPQVAVFDTAFFATMPSYVYIYGVPYEWYEKYHIRKYGFHGTSHYYVFRKAAALLGRKPAELKVITLHIGNGVSITAVKNGLAFDHSMGFTPLEGAVMGTRCGDIDPMIPLYVMQKEGLQCSQMEDILNRKSGLIAINGRYSDRREILQAMQNGDERAQLSFEIECYRLRKYIGAYAAGMGGLDAVAFTAGVGENSPLHRAKICEGLEFLGLKLDPVKNNQAVGGDKEAEISHPESPVKVLVIPTDEALILAEETISVLGNK